MLKLLINYFHSARFYRLGTVDKVTAAKFSEKLLGRSWESNEGQRSNSPRKVQMETVRSLSASHYSFQLYSTVNCNAHVCRKALSTTLVDLH